MYLSNEIPHKSFLLETNKHTFVKFPGYSRVKRERVAKEQVEDGQQLV